MWQIQNILDNCQKPWGHINERSTVLLTLLQAFAFVDLNFIYAYVMLCIAGRLYRYHQTVWTRSDIELCSMPGILLPVIRYHHQSESAGGGQNRNLKVVGATPIIEGYTWVFRHVVDRRYEDRPAPLHVVMLEPGVTSWEYESNKEWFSSQHCLPKIIHTKIMSRAKKHFLWHILS